MINNKYIAILLYVLLTIIFWNVMVYIHGVFVTGEGYHFTITMDLVTPILTGICLFFLSSVRR